MGVQGGLSIVHVASHQAVDDSSDLAALDVGGGTEVLRARIALEDLHAGHDVDAFLEGLDHAALVIEGPLDALGVGGNDQGEGHHHRQNQREKLLQISHRNVSSF